MTKNLSQADLGNIEPITEIAYGTGPYTFYLKRFYHDTGTDHGQGFKEDGFWVQSLGGTLLGIGYAPSGISGLLPEASGSFDYQRIQMYYNGFLIQDLPVTLSS